MEASKSTYVSSLYLSAQGCTYRYNSTYPLRLTYKRQSICFYHNEAHPHPRRTPSQTQCRNPSQTPCQNPKKPTTFLSLPRELRQNILIPAFPVRLLSLIGLTKTIRRRDNHGMLIPITNTQAGWRMHQ